MNSGPKVVSDQIDYFQVVVEISKVVGSDRVEQCLFSSIVPRDCSAVAKRKLLLAKVERDEKICSCVFVQIWHSKKKKNCFKIIPLRVGFKIEKLRFQESSSSFIHLPIH